MNKTQITQTQNNEKKTNTFKRFFNKHETAMEILMVVGLTSTSALGASYLGAKNQEERLVYKNIESQITKEDKSETITFKEPLTQGVYSTGDELAYKMFGSLEQKTDIKIGDETFYLSSVDRNRQNGNKDELVVTLKDKIKGKVIMINNNSFMEINVNGKTKTARITLVTVDTKEEGKKLKEIIIKNF